MCNRQSAIGRVLTSEHNPELHLESRLVTKHVSQAVRTSKYALGAVALLLDEQGTSVDKRQPYLAEHHRLAARESLSLQIRCE